MSDWLARALDEIEAQAAGAATSTATMLDDLRAAVSRDGKVDRDEACRLLDLHRTGAPVTGEAGWDAFFVEALVDHYALSRTFPEIEPEELSLDWKDVFAKVGRTFGAGRGGSSVDGPAWQDRIAALGVSPEEADQLIESLGANGFLLDPVEIRLLTRLFEQAVAYPANLRSFAWQALTTTILSDNIISQGEAALARAIAMGPGSEAGIALTRQEAEAIIAINNACQPDTKHAAWRDVFASCIGSYLLHAGKSPGVLDLEETSWLKAQLDGNTGAEVETLHRFLDAA